MDNAPPAVVRYPHKLATVPVPVVRSREASAQGARRCVEQQQQRAAADMAAANSGPIGTHAVTVGGSEEVHRTSTEARTAPLQRLLFSHILPINGLCMYVRVVSATPPSIVI